MCQTLKIPKILTFFQGLWKHLDWHGATHSGIGALEVPFLVKLTKMPLINLKLTEVKVGQNYPKTKFIMFLHQTQATRWFLSSLTKFYPRLTPVGTRNPNFDSTVRISWDQCHCKRYQISFPTTIHWSKSELKQLRYIENHEKYINTVPEAITLIQPLDFQFL